MPLAVEYVLFWVCLVAAAIVFLALFLYGPIKRFLYKHHTVRMYYRVVNRVAYDNDFLLVNRFQNKTAELEEFHIDHILFGDKFIYCIRDRYYDGAVVAKADDTNWMIYHKKSCEYFPNPMQINLLRVERMSLMSGIDQKIFISIVLINDDCYLTPFANESEDNYLISLKGLAKLIEHIEANPAVAPLDSREISIAARDFAELNTNGK